MKEMTLDARGLLCPLPVLKARKMLLTTAAPCRLTVQVSDPATEKDFRLFCADGGLCWGGATHTADGSLFIIKKI